MVEGISRHFPFAVSLKPIQTHYAKHFTVALPQCLAPRWIFMAWQPVSVISDPHATPPQGTGGGLRRLAGVLSSSCQLLLAVRPCYASALATSGGGIASCSIRARIAANNRRVTATSASWNVTYFKPTKKIGQVVGQGEGCKCRKSSFARPRCGRYRDGILLLLPGRPADGADHECAVVGIAIRRLVVARL